MPPQWPAQWHAHSTHGIRGLVDTGARLHYPQIFKRPPELADGGLPGRSPSLRERLAPLRHEEPNQCHSGQFPAGDSRLFWYSTQAFLATGVSPMHCIGRMERFLRSDACLLSIDKASQRILPTHPDSRAGIAPKSAGSSPGEAKRRARLPQSPPHSLGFCGLPNTIHEASSRQDAPNQLLSRCCLSLFSVFPSHVIHDHGSGPPRKKVGRWAAAAGSGGKRAPRPGRLSSAHRRNPCFFTYQPSETRSQPLSLILLDNPSHRV